MSFLPRSHFLLLLLVLSSSATGAEPLHTRIDALIQAGASGKPMSSLSDDAEFLRRVTLDLTGRIPTAAEARNFLDDKSPDKRSKWIDRLLASPEYPKHMAEWFHVHLMERLGDHAEWNKYLQTSFAANKPWDQMSREILRGSIADEASKGAAFFYAKRLENYGQNPVDYPALTRDVGRLFLGKDLRCAQCHDHLFIDEYKQQDFQGLFAFYQNTFLQDAATMHVGEKPTIQKMNFMSVFKKEPRETNPRLPNGTEVAIPMIEKGKEYLEPANPRAKNPGKLRFSPLERIAQTLPTAENADFNRNIVNRLWFLMMGRGLVYPLDLHHKDNPPSHPELLDLLAQEFVAHKYDIRWLLRELALTQTYQRSSLLPPGVTSIDPSRFRTALEKRLSAEQLLQSLLIATGEKGSDALKAKFLKAFANAPREPEDEIEPSLKAALFVLNDDAVISLLTPKPGNLIDQLGALSGDDKVAEELYLRILTRRPNAEEKAEVAGYLQKNAARRPVALGHLAWALLASTEFTVNH